MRLIYEAIPGQNKTVYFLLVDIIHSLSDFDAALGRARVLSFPESPSRPAMFDLELSDSEVSPTSLEGRFDFPCTPVSADLSKQFLTMDPDEEDKMMKTAASEIAKNLDLSVSFKIFTIFLFTCLQFYVAKTNNNNNKKSD